MSLAETFWIVFHNINRFLGSTSGELFKHAFELVLLTFTTYMIISEYLRNRDNKQLRELACGFGLLAIAKLLDVAIIGLNVFGGFEFTTIFAHMYLLESSIDLLAIWALIRYFVAPVLLRKDPRALRSITSMSVLVSVYAILTAFSFYSIYNTGSSFDDFYDLRSSEHFAILNFFRVFFLLAAIGLMWRYYDDFKKADSRHRSLFHAFILYAVAPTLELLNFILYDGQAPALIIIAHPFPFIAVAQFTRVMFLRIADKASILDRLNVTEKKYLKAQELSEMKDEFVSIVSHELKTPLTSINLYASMLEKGTLGESNPRQHEAYRTIKEECMRLSNLIQDMLDLSKLENKNMKIRREKIDLHALVEASLLKHMAEKKGIEILNEVPSGSVVSCDSDKMTQVLINLESNAIKFTDTGSVRVSFLRTPKHWTLVVSDSGVGIPTAKIPKLFDKFYQVEDHLTRKAGGTGLGLAIVKKIVDLHGGKIAVESIVGKGSTFKIIMPTK